MRIIVQSLAGAALLAAGAAQAERPSPQAELAKALAGRVAGAPVDCIDVGRSQSSRVIPGEAIIYRNGNILWLNRPRSGADALTGNEVLVTRTLSARRLCSSDTVVLHDRYSQAQTGLVFLGEFVPYRKAGSAD